jgi:2'-5' RNA ligase
MPRDPQSCFLGFIPDPEYAQSLEDWGRRMVRGLPRETRDYLQVIPWPDLHLTILYFKALGPEDRKYVWEKFIVPDLSSLGGIRGLAWDSLSLWPNPRRPSLFCLERSRYEPASQWKICREPDPETDRGDTGHLRDYRPHMTFVRFRRSWGRAHRRLPPDFVLPTIPAELRTARFTGVAFLLSDRGPGHPHYTREKEVNF